MLHHLEETALVFRVVRFGNLGERLLDLLRRCGALKGTLGLVAVSVSVISVVVLCIGRHGGGKGGTLTEFGGQNADFSGAAGRRMGGFVFRKRHSIRTLDHRFGGGGGGSGCCCRVVVRHGVQ